MSAAFGLLFLVVADATALSDLMRARTKVPRRDFCGGSFQQMGQVLNSHLAQNYGTILNCSDLKIDALRGIQERLFKVSASELLSIYSEATDNRRERHSSVDSMNEHWENLLARTPENGMPMLRDSLCHEIVMRFVHHTTDAVKEHLLKDAEFVLPSLPTEQHLPPSDSAKLAHEEYVAATGCQACHSRLVPLPSPETPDCDAQLKAKCGKRGVLMKDSCFSCVKQAELSACSAAEIDAWCDHPPACIGAETCPVWPPVFGAPFTLYSTIPWIRGAKSYFYYKYDSETQVQTVDYIDKCFPFVSASNFIRNKPCKLYFNPSGIYLSQPGRVDCCQFVAGVGAVPPEFLQSYTLVGQNVTAPDMYGNDVKCDEWSGPDGFKYWTSGKDDETYRNSTGHDIVFQDGPTGVTWRWGKFDPLPPGDHFTLPAGCDKACPKFLEAQEMAALHADAHVKRALAHHGHLGSTLLV